MTKLTQLFLPVPAGTKISSEYGERAMGSGNHYGIDFSVLSGVEVNSAGSGTVMRAMTNHKDFGNVVIVKHADDQATLYAHLKEIKINVGDEVSESTIIGLSGSTGKSTGPHLHFEVIEGAGNIVKIQDAENTGATGIGIKGSKGRSNPRQYFQHYTDAEFSATVVPGSSSFGTTSGDSRDNIIYGNSRQNTIEGLEGEDTYYFPSLSGSDQIIDPDLDGKIQIGSTVLSGNALPKTDSEGNAIDGIYSLSGFDLHKSSSGTDLVIVKAGADISASNVASVTVVDFPFSNSRGGFGITLGKKLDLIDRDIFTTQLIDSQLQGGFSLASSEDSFFGILRHVIGTSYFGSDDVVFFDSYGNQVASRGLKDAFQEMVSGDLLAPALDGLKASNPYSYEVNGKRYFASNVGETGYDSSSGLSRLYSRVGAILFDDDGNIINSHIYQNVKDGENPYAYVRPFGFYVSRENPEDLYYVYSAQNSSGSSRIVAQKVDKLTLDQIGNLIEYSSTIWNRYGNTLYQGASLATPQPNSQEFTLGNDVEISLSGANKVITSRVPKLRDLLPSEITPNQDLTSGTQTTSGAKSEILTFPEGVDVNLEVLANPNSVLALVGLEGSEVSKVNLPAEDRSQIQVYSTTASEYSLEELMAGGFNADPSKALEMTRRLTEENQQDGEFVSEAARQLNEANFTDYQSSFSYDYSLPYSSHSYNYYNDDNAVDDVDLSVKSIAQPSTILILPNNQTVILVGVNATEIAKTPESYFLTQAEITNSPSVAPTQPSNNPSGPPSFLPSGPPSEIPSGLPTELPSGSPSEIPSTAPSELPSGPPSFLPSSAPSYLPNPQPSNNPVENPTNGPIEAPSSMPIPNPAPQPSVENSFEPTSQLPLSQPTPYFTAENSFVPSFPPIPPMDHYSSDFPSLAPSSLENTNNNSPELPNAAILGAAAGAAVFVCTALNYIRKRLNVKNKVHAEEIDEEKDDAEMVSDRRGGR